MLLMEKVGLIMKASTLIQGNDIDKFDNSYCCYFNKRILEVFL